MIKLLHTADLHLDSLFRGLPPQQAEAREAQRALPQALAKCCREKGAQLALFSGDLFERPQAGADSVECLCGALEEMAVPVFIAPGNHDYYTWESPYYSKKFPGNVHIFTENTFRSVSLPDLDCRVYGAAYTQMDCPGLLSAFQREGQERYHIALLHGELSGGDSPYCPITRGQVAGSGLHYLALGHNHTRGQVQAGQTLCAWPGCPMGRGFDEEGAKGAYFVTVQDTDTKAEFIPLGFREYHDVSLSPEEDILSQLPGLPERDIYRITLTGEAQEPDLAALAARLSPHVYSLILRDRTTPPLDLWQTAEADSLEGRYFSLLKEASEQTAEDELRRRLILAARISRKLLEGREVVLP